MNTKLNARSIASLTEQRHSYATTCIRRDPLWAPASADVLTAAAIRYERLTARQPSLIARLFYWFFGVK
jgi:hypothetical protein